MSIKSYELALHQTLELDNMKPKRIREESFKRRYKILIEKERKAK
jgi:hypothetical protein